MIQQYPTTTASTVKYFPFKNVEIAHNDPTVNDKNK